MPLRVTVSLHADTLPHQRCALADIVTRGLPFHFFSAAQPPSLLAAPTLGIDVAAATPATSTLDGLNLSPAPGTMRVSFGAMAWSKCLFGSAPACPLCHLSVRLADLGSSVLPE